MMMDMDWFQDDSNTEHDGAWMLVDPRNLEPIVEKPVPNSPTPLPEVSLCEEADSLAEPALEVSPSEGRKEEGEIKKGKKLPMYLRDPEEEGLTPSEKRQILKAKYSKNYRLKDINQSKDMQDEIKVLKKDIVDAQDKMNRWMSVIIQKYLLVQNLMANNSASN